MVAVSSILSGAKRVIKVLPDLVLGNGAEVAGQAIKTTIKNKGSIFEAAKAGVKINSKRLDKNSIIQLPPLLQVVF